MIEIHGHRGFRGRFPENTVISFIEAIKAGASAIELDVVVSQDLKIVVSHEPWMSHKICLAPGQIPIPEAEEKNHNLYRMPYAQIRKYDCGSKSHPDFPFQKKIPAFKPLLSEVLYAVRANFPSISNQIKFTIEVKSSPEESGIFFPDPEKYVRILLSEIISIGLSPHQILLQSFDLLILQHFKKLAPEIPLGLLVEENVSAEDCIAKLGFLPDNLNPEKELFTPGFATFCRKNNLKTLPWTVNTEAEMLRMLKIGASGLITDFPDRAREVVKKFQQKEMSARFSF